MVKDRHARGKAERHRIYRAKTGSAQYFFNTNKGMIRACAYWMVRRPDAIAKLYNSSTSGYRKYQTAGTTRDESLMNLIMVSSLGFRVKNNTDSLVRPGKDGSNYFTLNYDFTRKAIGRLGGKTAIDPLNLVMWKHRAYFQAISTLQMYAENFRELTEGLETLPDAPGWLITGMMNLRKGIELPDTETAITATVAVCEREADTEQADYEAELSRRDAQIESLNRTISSLTSSLEDAQDALYRRRTTISEADYSELVSKHSLLAIALYDANIPIPRGSGLADPGAVTYEELNKIPSWKRQAKNEISSPGTSPKPGWESSFDDSPPDLPPRDAPVAPPAPNLAPAIIQGKTALRLSIRAQKGNQDKGQRIQHKGGNTRKVFLGQIAKGDFNLKPVVFGQQGPEKTHLETTDKDVSEITNDIMTVLTKALAKMNFPGDGDVGKSEVFGSFSDECIDSHFAQDIGSLFHAFSRIEGDEYYSSSQRETPVYYEHPSPCRSPRSRSEWKTNLSDVFS